MWGKSKGVLSEITQKRGTCWKNRKGVISYQLQTMILIVINRLFHSLVIKFVSKRGSEEVWHGYIYAVLMFVNSLGQSLLLHQYFHGVIVVGMNFRSALLTMIYRKVRTFYWKCICCIWLFWHLTSYVIQPIQRTSVILWQSCNFV